ncbi:MAG: flagellar motor protein MotB [Paracoccaceae bacterium]|nr:flagellar motor protein MotB [Paracoccaceae bacterium]
MSETSGAGNAGPAPVIIKRKKVVSGDGHHGGAWKVAYADFVTAMMAFFLLMWLLNATTEKQRKGIADYFNPTIPVNRISGGGEGMFGGDSVFSEDSLSQNGTGGETRSSSPQRQARGQSGVSRDQSRKKEDTALKMIETKLKGNSGESEVADKMFRHILTRVTDEGLVIELFDLPDSALFEKDSSTPTKLLRDIIRMISDLLRTTRNKIAVAGYTLSYPIVLRDNPVWDLSTARAQKARRMLERAGTPDIRMQRVVGWADKKPAVKDPMAVRNNRIEITLLRKIPGG